MFREGILEEAHSKFGHCQKGGGDLTHAKICWWIWYCVQRPTLTFILHNSHHYTFKAQQDMSNKLLQYLCEDGSGDAGVLTQAKQRNPCLVLLRSLLGWSTATNTWRRRSITWRWASVICFFSIVPVGQCGLVHCCTLSLCYLGAETGYRVATPDMLR